MSWLEPLRRHLTSRYWARAFAHGGITTWMSEPVARRYINESITGDPNVWPLEWFMQRFARTPFERGVSLGCGDGALERDVRRKNICRQLVGIDISEGALRLAREHASQEGIHGIDYELADFNRLDFAQRRFDIAFSHQALHHVRELESCLTRVSDALNSGGLLYLEEYVGPSRHEWRRAHLRHAEEALSRVLPRARRRRRLRPPIDRGDPSEGIRSSEILGTVARIFDVVEQRPYGGNLLALVYPHLRLGLLPREEADGILEDLIRRERELREEGELPFCAVVVASKRNSQ